MSTEEQARSGLGLEAQVRGIRMAAMSGGWELVDIITDAGLPGSNTHCPGLTDALARIRRHDADLLVVAKLDGLSRWIRDGADVIDGANRQGWALAGVLHSAAQYERHLIGVRTREGLADAKARGVKLGAQTAYPDALLERIHGMHRGGMCPTPDR